MTEVLTENSVGTHEVTLTQKIDDWQNTDDSAALGKIMTLSGTPTSGGKAVLTYDAKTETVTCTLS